MTPGQIAGGWAKTLEDKLSGYPVIGDAITAGRLAARDTFNVGAGKRAGYAGKEAGHEMIAQIGDDLGSEYNAILSKSRANLIDPTFITEVKGVDDLVKTLPKREYGQFKAILSREVGGRATQGGMVAGESLQAMESGLGKQINNFKGSTDGYQRQLGEALEQVKSSLHSLVERSTPESADALNALSRNYANYKRLESAAASPGASNGVFTLHSYGVPLEPGISR